MNLSLKNKRFVTINLGVQVSIELCQEIIERNPINGCFCRSPKDTGKLDRWINRGKFSSQSPFRVLDDDPLTEVLLIRHFESIVLSRKYKEPSNQGM